MKINWKLILPHLVALTVFLVVTISYFSPVLEGYTLRTHDVKMHKGMSKEIMDFREETGEEPLWTDAMFGGMPAAQISVVYSKNLFRQVYKVLTLGLPSPASRVWAYFIGFYILLMCLKINPWLSIVGALAFGLSSYFFIILEAGHMTKAIAIAFMPPVIGGIVLLYRGKLLWGFAITSFFMALELNANHYQITYYFLFVIVAIAVVQLIKFIKEKDLMSFVKRSLLIGAASILGLLVNLAGIWGTLEYSKDSTRGKNELTIEPGGGLATKNQTSGLDRDYIVNWSYGKEETLTLLVPNAKGGGSRALVEGMQKKQQAGESPTEAEIAAYNQYQSRRLVVSEYFGNQPMTSGPVYIGAVVVFLAFLALFFARTPLVVALFIATVITVMLSWGKNMMWFTNLFLDYLPGYNKFRAVSMILVVAEFCLPLMGMVFAAKLIAEREAIRAKFKTLLISGGSFLFFLIVLATVKPGISFLTDRERDVDFSVENLVVPSQITQENAASYLAKTKFQIEQDLPKIIEHRKQVFNADVWRSFGFVLFAFALIILFVFGKSGSWLLISGLGILVVADMVGVNLRYLNNNKINNKYESWVKVAEEDSPYQVFEGDYDLMFHQVAKREGKLNEVYGKMQQTATQKGAKLSKSEERKVWMEVLAETEFFKKVQVALKAKADRKGATLTPLESQSVWFYELSKMYHFRVFDVANPFNDARASYFYKSVGGYHGAKMKRYQDLINFYIGYGNEKVLDMLNTQYIIRTEADKVDFQPRPTALGSAWLVGDYQLVTSANEEILALSDSMGFDPANVMVADQKFESLIGEKIAKDPQGKIAMVQYAPNHITYNFSAQGDQLAVFSEIFYENGWQAYIDGKPVDHFRCNYVLRGLKIPSGDHVVAFKFQLKSFETGQLISLLASILTLGLFAFAVYRSLKKDNPKLAA